MNLVTKAVSLCLSLVGLSSAFVVPPSGTLNGVAKDTELYGLFDFEAFHGGGSAKQEELDEQWETQQAILAARRGHTHHTPQKKQQHQSHQRRPAARAKQIKVVTEIDDEPAKAPKKMKFFWEK